ncbi:hypothetical protein KEM54_006049 [Ascosphaera aggregata]|nr:hypothetical protein KEM54_006049 [Ascosphaera aggregata]
MQGFDMPTIDPPVPTLNGQDRSQVPDHHHQTGESESNIEEKGEKDGEVPQNGKKLGETLEMKKNRSATESTDAADSAAAAAGATPESASAPEYPGQPQGYQPQQQQQVQNEMMQQDANAYFVNGGTEFGLSASYVDSTRSALESHTALQQAVLLASTGQPQETVNSQTVTAADMGAITQSMQHIPMMPPTTEPMDEFNAAMQMTTPPDFGLNQQQQVQEQQASDFAMLPDADITMTDADVAATTAPMAAFFDPLTMGGPQFTQQQQEQMQAFPAASGAPAFSYQNTEAQQTLMYTQAPETQAFTAAATQGMTATEFGDFTGATPSVFQQQPTPDMVPGFMGQSPVSMNMGVDFTSQPPTTTGLAAATPYELMQGGTPYMHASQAIPMPPQPSEAEIQQAQQQQMQQQAYQEQQMQQQAQQEQQMQQQQMQQQAQQEQQVQQQAQQEQQMQQQQSQQFVAGAPPAMNSEIQMYAGAMESSAFAYTMLPLPPAANPVHQNYTQALLGINNPPQPSPTYPDDAYNDGFVYSCTYHGCKTRLETASQLQRHKRDQHRNNQMYGRGDIRNTQAGPHRCRRLNPSTGKRCDSVFSRPYDLTRHEDTIHNTRRPKVKCCFCSEEKTFSRNDALTRHMRVVHPDIHWPGKTKRKARSKKNEDGTSKPPPAKKKKTSKKDDGSASRTANETGSSDPVATAAAASTAPATETKTETEPAPPPESAPQMPPAMPQVPHMPEMPDVAGMSDMDIAMADMAELTMAMAMAREQEQQQQQQQQFQQSQQHQNATVTVPVVAGPQQGAQSIPVAPHNPPTVQQNGAKEEQAQETAQQQPEQPNRQQQVRRQQRQTRSRQPRQQQQQQPRQPRQRQRRQ